MSQDGVWTLCQQYLESGGQSEDIGRRAISAAAQASQEETEKVIACLVKDSSKPHQASLAPKILGAVWSSSEGQRWLVHSLQERPSETFGSAWASGFDAMKPLIALLTKPTAWSSEPQRTGVEIDILHLLLAKLLEAAVDNPELAMTSLARLLAIDHSHLSRGIETDTFTMVLPYLEISNPVSIRSQATLVITKMLEAKPEQGKEALRAFVVTKISPNSKDHTTPGTSDIVVAFSVAGALFPVVPDLASELFLTPGFVEELSRVTEIGESSTLRLAGLELLSAACLAKPCRELITKNCGSFLRRLARVNPHERETTLAALILSKIDQGSKPLSDESDDELVAKLKDVTLDTDTESRDNSLEALAYQSMRPLVKQDLASDSDFLKRLIQSLSKDAMQGASLYAGLTVIKNLVTYQPIIALEQKKMMELKACANQSKVDEPHPLDSDANVSARCKKVLEADVASLLRNLVRKATPGILGLIGGVAVSLSKFPSHRGAMIQSGMFVTMLICANASCDKPFPGTTSDTSTRKFCLTVARCVVSTNPSLLFGRKDTSILESTLRALYFLVKESDTAEPADPECNPAECQFESIRAMTNMASLQDESDNDIPSRITRDVWSCIESHFLSENNMIRRAIIELTGNLMPSPKCAAKFIGDDKKSKANLHVFIAFFGGAEDMRERHAAGNALVFLTTSSAGIACFLRSELGMRYVVDALKSEDEGVQLRAVSILMNCLVLPEPPNTLALRAYAANHYRALGAENALASLEHGPHSNEIEVKEKVDMIREIFQTDFCHVEEYNVNGQVESLMAH